MEQRYQDQIKALQLEIDSEREILNQQTSKQRTQMEAEIEGLKEQEMQMKDKLAITQKVRTPL